MFYFYETAGSGDYLLTVTACPTEGAFLQECQGIGKMRVGFNVPSINVVYSSNPLSDGYYALYIFQNKYNVNDQANFAVYKI
jgi:hypothetical protein